MNAKKIILKIRREDATCLYGVLTPTVIQEVCQRTGLDESQVLASIERLERLGIIDKEIAILH